MNKILSACVLLFVSQISAHAGEIKLSTWIDENIEAKVAKEGAQLSTLSDDATFLRRAYLDFAGTLPTSNKVRAFLNDNSTDKRSQLIQELLSASTYSKRMADAFHVMLMERRGEDENWQKYLEDAFAQNKPWDQIVREILNPDFMDEINRGAGYFITKRLTKSGQQPTDYPGLTRDVGRLFMGVDLQCAQCHKHLTVKDYKQIDFNGLFVAYKNLKLNIPTGDFKTPWVSENLVDKEYEFVSVFSEKRKTTPPRIPFGKSIPIPELDKEQMWEVKPDRRKKVVGIPAFRPLKEVSLNLTANDNPWFAKNAVNRIWFLMMGRGLVEPLDLQHSSNPPSHPELLDRLAEEFVAHKYDVKWLLSQLANTRTYQRSSLLPNEKAPSPQLFATALERPLTALQLQTAFLQATAEPTSEEIEEAFYDAFANPPKEPELQVNPTLRSALFLRNSTFVDSALQPKEGNLIETLQKTEEDQALIETAFLTIYSRLPDAEEVDLFAQHLKSNQDNRLEAIQQLTWSLLSSMEFFANH